MRIRTLVDVQLPLKRSKKVKRPGSDWITCSFKYEKLPSFCFLCGLIRHIDHNCEKYYQSNEDELVRGWDASLRAPKRWQLLLGGECCSRKMKMMAALGFKNR